MKKKIEIWKTTRVKETVDVEFPIYRKYDLLLDESDSVIYTRIDADGQACNIEETISSGETEFTLAIENHYRFDESEVDYHLGLGRYKSSAEEFETTLARALQFLEKFRKLKRDP